MSDSYTHFCVHLPISAEQGQEMKSLLEWYEVWAQYREINDQDQYDGPSEFIPTFEGLYDSDYESWSGIEIKIEEEPRGREVGVYLEDFGGQPNLELAGKFIREIMRRYDVDGPIALEFGYTGPRPGHNGGGAALITRDGIEWMGTKEWIAERLLTPGNDAGAPTP